MVICLDLEGMSPCPCGRRSAYPSCMDWEGWRKEGVLLLEKVGWAAKRTAGLHYITAARWQLRSPFQEAVVVVPDSGLVLESSPVELEIILPGRGLSPVPGSQWWEPQTGARGRQ